MTPTPTAALDADIRALRDAAYQEGYHAGNVAALCEVANAAESRLRTTVEELQRERDGYRSALLEIASGRKPGARLPRGHRPSR